MCYAKYSKIIGTVIADGVKTIAAILNELYPASGFDIHKEYKLIITDGLNNAEIAMAALTLSTGADFFTHYIGRTSSDIGKYKVRNNNSEYVKCQWFYVDNSIGYMDSSNSVAPSGNIYTLLG